MGTKERATTTGTGRGGHKHVEIHQTIPTSGNSCRCVYGGRGILLDGVSQPFLVYLYDCSVFKLSGVTEGLYISAI